MSGKVSMTIMVVINCIILLCFYVITLYLADVLKRRTAKKRAEFVAKKEKEAQDQQAQEFSDVQEFKQKIKQKQKKNYPSTKRKK